MAYTVKLWFRQLQQLNDARTEVFEVSEGVFPFGWSGQSIVVRPIIPVRFERDDI